MEMHAYTAILSLLDPLTILLIFLCSIFGVILGAIPGLSGGLGVAILLPVTFGMQPELGLASLMSVWVGGVSGAMIGSILLGIPGSPSSIATTFDGYPMTRNGEAVRALGAATIASFIGTFFSILVSMSISPLIAAIAIKLGPWEYFSLGVCALSLVAALSRASIFHGLAAAALGLLLSCVGFAPIDGNPRFTMGSMYLGSGFDLIALMLGLFAVKQIFQDHVHGAQKVPDVNLRNVRGFGVSYRDLRANGYNILRSFMIGLWIGFLPGMGSALSNMVAYAKAKSASRHPEKFGTGYIDGVFASETSNNAAVGGALIPMISLGIPGDGTTAILLGGLMVHGVQAGPLMMSNNPEIVYAIFGAALISAVMVLIFQLVGVRLFPAILKIPAHFLHPAIIVMSFLGVFVTSSTGFNYIVLLCFAALGLVLDKLRLPVSSFLLAFILGPMLELNLRKGMTYTQDGFLTFLTRPISGLLLAAAVLSILWPYLKPVVQGLRERSSRKSS